MTRTVVFQAGDSQTDDFAERSVLVWSKAVGFKDRIYFYMAKFTIGCILLELGQGASGQAATTVGASPSLCDIFSKAR
jgi:hypothetical protein